MRKPMVFDHMGCLEVLDLRISLSTVGVGGSPTAPAYGYVACAEDPIPDPEPSPGPLPTDPTTTPTSPTSGPAGPGTS